MVIILWEIDGFHVAGWLSDAYSFNSQSSVMLFFRYCLKSYRDFAPTRNIWDDSFTFRWTMIVLTPSDHSRLWRKTGKLWLWINTSLSILSPFGPSDFFLFGWIKNRQGKRRHETENEWWARSKKHYIVHFSLCPNHSFQGMDWVPSNIFEEMNIWAAKQHFFLPERTCRKSMASSPGY
jgi:hypothetical protein